MAVPHISLAQFNKIATGDYNAGLVDFKTDDNGNVQNALKKVNHHVICKSLNKRDSCLSELTEFLTTKHSSTSYLTIGKDQSAHVNTES